MKTSITQLFLTALLALGATNELRGDENIPLFVFINMHVEQLETYHEDPPLFAETRSNLVAFAELLYSNGVMFNFQSDWTFLSAVTNFDQAGDPVTGGTNVIAWMHDDLGFEIDPHNHYLQSDYNLADCAYLIEQCGAVPSGIVGGFTAGPAEDSELGMFQGPVTGGVYTAYTWDPTILTGGGTAGHAGEQIYWFSGVWKPMDATNYAVHSESGGLVNVGRFGLDESKWGKLEMLIDARSAGQLCTGRIYTCSIATHIRDLTNSTFQTEFETNLHAYLEVTNLFWVGVQEAVNIWQVQYNSEPNLFPRILNADLDGDGMNDGWEITNFCGISDSNGRLDSDGDTVQDADEYIAGTSPTNALEFFHLSDIQFQSDSAGNVVLDWATVPERTYHLDAAPDINRTWSNVLSATASNNLMSYTNLIPFAERHFRCRVSNE